MKLIVFILFYTSVASAQLMDTVLHIDQVVVSADSLRIKSQEIPINKNNDQLLRLLSAQSPLFIKNYGPSAIATLSHRGGNASQTSVTWNGVPISNPMLGLSDISLLHSFLISDVTLNTASNPLSGLTGSLDNNSAISNKTQLTIYNSIGSFSNKEHGLKGELNLGKFAIQANLLSLYGKNDFEYKLTNGKEETTTHAQNNQLASTLGFKFTLNKTSFIQYSTWFQETSREIPKLTTQSKSKAVQEDKIWRNSLNFQYIKDKMSLKLDLGYTKESIFYEDSLANISDDSNFKSAFAKVDFAYYTKLGRTSILLQNQNIESFALAYRSSRNLNITRIDIKHNIKYKWSESYLNLSVSKSTTTEIYPGFDLGTHFHLSPKSIVYANIKQAVRFPTTNDLYWANGGDQSLNPEESLNKEIGFNYKNSKGQFSLAYYHRNVENWILWALPTNGSFYRVQNLANVISHGLEFGSERKITFLEQLKCTFWLNGNIGKSTNKISILNPKIKEGDQLFYTPKIKTAFGIDMIYNSLTLHSNYQFVSETQGINLSLSPYGLMNFEIHYKLLQKKRAGALVGFQLNNATNRNYRILENRPMPGRNFKLLLNITIHK